MAANDHHPGFTEATVPRRLVLLDRVWRRPDGRGPLDWGRVAVEAGYADQAHLVRDFGRFTGMTPTQFRPGCARGGR